MCKRRDASDPQDEKPQVTSGGGPGAKAHTLGAHSRRTSGPWRRKFEGERRAVTHAYPERPACQQRRMPVRCHSRELQPKPFALGILAFLLLPADRRAFLFPSDIGSICESPPLPLA